MGVLDISVIPHFGDAKQYETNGKFYEKDDVSSRGGNLASQTITTITIVVLVAGHQKRTHVTVPKICAYYYAIFC